MSLSKLANGSSVFIDANIFVYAFAPAPPGSVRPAGSYWSASNAMTCEGLLRLKS